MFLTKGQFDVVLFLTVSCFVSPVPMPQTQNKEKILCCEN